MTNYKAHKRYVLKDGRPCVGTTTVCSLHSKPQLINWANRLGLDNIEVSKYKDHLADIGSCAHLLIEAHLKAVKDIPQLDNYSKEQIDIAKKCLDKFFQWVMFAKDFEVIEIELPLVSEAYEFGGTIDIYCNLNGKKTLIDIKTGGVYPDHHVQLAAYNRLLLENNYEVEDVRIIQVPRSDKEQFSDIVIPALDLNWKKFYHLLQIYKINRELKV